MDFLSTFRGRLLVILAILLLTTLGVQYYLNIQIQRENLQTLELRERAFLSGITLGFNSITSNDRIQDLVEQEGQVFYDPRTRERIKDILIINNEWEVNDSLSDEYLPSVDENDSEKAIMIRLEDIKNLPPLQEGADKLGEDIKRFPNRPGSTAVVDEGEAHVIPIETSQGTWYVMVLIKEEESVTFFRAAEPLVYTLAILLISIVVTIILVWRFTKPISQLSQAARRVAQGQLDSRVDDAGRNDEVGQLTRQFNFMTDELAKNQNLQKQLQEAEKSAVVGRLASAIAHEIRNPLNYINLSLEHLRKNFGPEDPEKQETFTKLTRQLKVEVDRINDQIVEFLRYSRPTKLDLAPISLYDVVQASLRIVEHQAEEQSIEISCIERDLVPKANGDSEVLRSVFNNFFLNAIQAMEDDGGKLTVRLFEDGDNVAVEIEDTGVGIDDEHLEKIFEPYFSTKETGTGLGLAIVRKIVEDHSGTLDVESKPGEGTTFTVRLPKFNEENE